MSSVRDFLLKTEYCHRRWRIFYIELVERFIGLNLADRHFIKSLTESGQDSFWERIWEAIIGCYLADLGFDPTSSDKGPDFLCNIDGQRVWVEAICPRPKGIPDAWLKRIGVYTMPVKELSLNWTAALKEKRDKLEGTDNKLGYIGKELVAPDDAYIIALNSSRLGDCSRAEIGISQFPYSAEVGIGIGPIAVPIDRAGNFGEAKYTTRFNIKNANSAEVGTAVFLDKSYAGISAVLSSGHFCPQPNTFSFTLVHNPLARTKLPTGRMRAVDEYACYKNIDTVVLERQTT